MSIRTIINNRKHAEFKKVCFQLVFLAFANIAFGQGNKLKLGCEGGLSLASMWINGEHQKLKVGGQFGLYTQIPLNETVSFKTGLYLEQKGAHINLYSLAGAESKAILALKYLTIPVLVRADFGQEVRFFLNGGPYVGVLLQSYIKEEKTGNSETNTDRFKKTEWGLAGGVGLSFQLAKKFGLSFEIRDYLGISNNFKNTTGGGGTMRTNSIQFLLGVFYTVP